MNVVTVDLLTLRPYGAVAIVTPTQFLAMHAAAVKEYHNGDLTKAKTS